MVPIPIYAVPKTKIRSPKTTAKNIEPKHTAAEAKRAKKRDTVASHSKKSA